MSATFKYQVGGFSLDTVPGYLVWVALFFMRSVVTGVAHIIGRVLIQLNFNKEKAEATFRYSLARTREYGEQIALLKGAVAESEVLDRKYDGIVNATWALVDRQKESAALQLCRKPDFGDPALCPARPGLFQRRD